MRRSVLALALPIPAALFAFAAQRSGGAGGETIVVAPLAVAAVGWALAARDRVTRGLLFVIAVAGACGIGSVCAEALVGGWDACLSGGGPRVVPGLGIVLGLALLPIIAATLREPARDGSLVAASYERVVVAVAAMTASIFALLAVLPRHDLQPDLGEWLRAQRIASTSAIASVVTITTVLAYELRTLRRVRRHEPGPVDLGLGEEHLESWIDAKHYRDAAKTETRYVGSPQRARRALVASTAITVVALGVAAVVLVALAGLRAPEPAPFPPVAIVPSPPPPPSPIRVVYTADTTYEAIAPDGAMTFVRLAGIGRTSRRGVLATRRGGSRPAFSYDVFDLDTGKRLERWDETGAGAGQPRDTWFRPMSGTVDGDLARLAGLADSLDDRALEVAVSPGGRWMIYDTRPKDGHDGDWLMLRDRTSGAPDRKLRANELAGYAPTFSPDGTRVAWYGCSYGGCPYSVWTAKVGGPATAITSGNAYDGPTWSNDSRRIYFTQTSAGVASVHVYDVGAGKHQVIGSSDMLGDLTLDVAPDGRTALVVGRIVHPPPDPHFGARGWSVNRWIELPSGKLLAEYVDPGKCVLVSNEGQLLCERSDARHGGTLRTFDLRNNEERAFTLGDCWLSSLTRLDDHTVLAVRERLGRRTEVVAIDTRAITDKIVQ